MTRGKHSTAASARRLAAAQAEAESYRKAYQQEARAHRLARAEADRVDGLEAEIKKLRMDLDLATSDELERALQDAEDALARLAESVLWAVGELSHATCPDCGVEGTPRGISAGFWHKLPEVIGTKAAADIWSRDGTRTREGRRNASKWSVHEWQRIMEVVTSAKALGLDWDQVTDCVAADLNGPDQLRLQEAARRSGVHALDPTPVVLGAQGDE